MEITPCHAGRPLFPLHYLPERTRTMAPKPEQDFTPVYLTREIREIEQAVASAPDAPNLMERAGLAAAEIARELAPGKGGSVLAFAGPGNNGGDAFVIARHLKTWWFDVSVVFTGDAARLSADASAALRAWQEAGGVTVASPPPPKPRDLLIDGLFGIGLQRELTGPHLELVRWMNAQPAPVLAVDIPSGLESDTGRVLGEAVRAAHTATFIGLKPGLLTEDGPDCCGRLHLCRLDLETAKLKAPSAWLVNESIVPATLPPRPRNSHKGLFGDVGILGGAEGMVGAALLAARAALRIGAGRIYCGLLAADAPRVDFVQPELMLRGPDFLFEPGHASVLVVGPGLGTSSDAAGWVATAIDSRLPLLLDADALNLVAAIAELQQRLAHRGAPTVLTPHPAEAGRLLSRSTAEVQANRVAAALEIATRFQSACVLKGVGTVCAFPGGTWYVNPSGNPGMAAAGMGDVLSGLIGGLLAQGAHWRSATLCGVYLHGAAADLCVARGTGPAGLTASEVMDAARQLLNHPQTGASSGAERRGRLYVN
jgi:hydroxyethylthiazole kinase-like uncharacterized protein yjeF